MEIAHNVSSAVTNSFDNSIDTHDACGLDDNHGHTQELFSEITIADDHSAAVKHVDIKSDHSSVTKYAPKMPIKKGTYDLYPISLSWTDVPGASSSQLKNMGNDVASTYSRLSDGAIKFNVKPAGIYRTGVARSANAVPEESSKAKIKFTDRNSPYVGFYAIVNNRAKKVSHAGAKTASLLTPLYTTARHEVGHLLGLQHANRYAIITSGPHKGEKEFQSSRDGSSFMSIYSSRNLTSAQMYAMGWYKEQQVAMYEIDDPEIIYDLQPVCDKANDNYFNAVYMPNAEGKNPVFLSMFETEKSGNKVRLLALHVGQNGGSTSLTVFKNHTETNDVNIDLIAEEREYWKVKVSPNKTARK